MGGIVPVVNVEGVKPGEMVLDGPTLAKIFLGKIKAGTIRRSRSSIRTPICRSRRSPWFAARTARAPPLTSPTISRRSATDWKTKVGVNTPPQWPAGIGAKGNEGVADNVAKTKGSIGYVEYAYAKQNKLTHTKMINKAGKTAEPTSASFQAAAANADWSSQPGFGVILANQPGDDVMADDRRHVDPDPQAAAGRQAAARSAQVLRLGLRQGRQDGRRARLCPDARQGRGGRRDGLGRRHQGRER